MNHKRKPTPTEADDAGLTRYLSVSKDTSALLVRLQRNIQRATEPELRKRLTDAIEFVKEEAA